MQSKYKKQYQQKKWREYSHKVKTRDGYKCTECGRSKSDGVSLQVHHIHYKKGLDIWDYPLDSCVTLCKGCHAREHNLIQPSEGWTLVSVYGINEPINCERHGCKAEIKYIHEVYHPQWGYIDVGCDCVEFMTNTGGIVAKRIRSIRRSMLSFLALSEWHECTTKNGNRYISSYYRGVHLMRVYKNNAVQVARKRTGSNWYDYSKIYNKKLNIDQAKQFAYLLIRGWLSSKDQDKHLIRQLISNL